MSTLTRACGLAIAFVCLAAAQVPTPGGGNGGGGGGGGGGTATTVSAGVSGAITVDTSTPNTAVVDIDTAVVPRKATAESISGLYTFTNGMLGLKGTASPSAGTCTSGSYGMLYTQYTPTSTAQAVWACLNVSGTPTWVLQGASTPTTYFASGYSTAAFSAVANNTWTTLSFDSNQSGSSTSVHSTSSNTSRFYAPASGQYMAVCQVSFSGYAGLTAVGARIMLNGTSNVGQTYIQNSGYNTVQASQVVNMASGDYVECQGNAYTGTPAPTNGQYGGSGASVTDSNTQMTLRSL